MRTMQTLSRKLAAFAPCPRQGCISARFLPSLGALRVTIESVGFPLDGSTASADRRRTSQDSPVDARNRRLVKPGMPVTDPFGSRRTQSTVIPAPFGQLDHCDGRRRYGLLLPGPSSEGSCELDGRIW